MMAPKLRFSRSLKAKAPGAATACVPGPLRRRSSTTTGTRSNDGEGDDFFFLPSRVFQVYDCSIVNSLLSGSFLPNSRLIRLSVLLSLSVLKEKRIWCMIVILPTFWHSAPGWDFSWQLQADPQCFTRNDARTFVPTIPRGRLWLGERSLWVETSRSSFTAEVWLFSPRHPRHQFPFPANIHRHSSPSLSTRRNQLSPRSPS